MGSAVEKEWIQDQIRIISQIDVDLLCGREVKGEQSEKQMSGLGSKRKADEDTFSLSKTVEV